MRVDLNRKPFGCRNYGSIPHLSGSRLGEKDYKANEGQERIATVKTRDRHDYVIVQEKLDGSNCGVGKLNGQILALTRAGYLASTSPYEQHRIFADWVETNKDRFDTVLNEGERLVGEWLALAHSTRYELQDEPFAVFDLMRGNKRATSNELNERCSEYCAMPPVLYVGFGALPLETALIKLGDYGHYGAVDKAEGVVYRVERKGEVDFLCKYVRQDKVDGALLPEKTGKPPVWNWTKEKD